MILQMADPVKELKEIRFTSEKEMQHFCEKMVDYLKKALIYGHTSRISS